MAIRFSKSAATLALGVAFLVTPALLHSSSLFSVDSAFAAKGGNGNGNSGGNGMETVTLAATATATAAQKVKNPVLPKPKKPQNL